MLIPSLLPCQPNQAEIPTIRLVVAFQPAQPKRQEQWHKITLESQSTQTLLLPAIVPQQKTPR